MAPRRLTTVRGAWAPVFHRVDAFDHTQPRARSAKQERALAVSVGPQEGGAFATRPTTTVMLSSPPRLFASSTRTDGKRRYQVIATIRSSSPGSTWFDMP